MEVEKEVRRMPAKSQPIHPGLSALTANCELYKLAVDFTIQVSVNYSVAFFFFNVVICVFTALHLIFNKDVYGSI